MCTGITIKFYLDISKQRDGDKYVDTIGGRRLRCVYYRYIK